MSAIRIPIADGINLNVIETDKFKTNYISVNFLVPLRRETAAYNALLPKVLRRGTVSWPDMSDISRRLEYLYATNLSTRLYKRGETQVFGFGAYVLDNSFALDGTDILGGVLDLIGELIFRPVLENGCFREDYVTGEKSNLIDDIRAQINNKTSYAVIRCHQEMCRNEAFGISECGTPEEVEAITPASLYRHYKEMLSCADVEIYYVGHDNTELLKSKLRQLFAAVKHTPHPPLSCRVIRRAEEVREVVEDEQVRQGKLSLGFRTGTVLSDGDYHRFSLFCEIFSGSPTSKLFMNVREKLSLCYYCRAVPEAQKGIMVVTSGIEVSNRGKAQEEILRQLDAMRHGEITDGELEDAKRSLVNSYREINDTPTALEAWYMGRLLAGLNNTPEENAALVKQTTKEEIVAVASGITLDTVYFMRGTLTGDQEEGEDGDE